MVQERVMSVVRRVGARLGVEMPLSSYPRAVLEQMIIPSYANRHDIRRVLFVGCDYYTSHYWKFFRHKEFWTIDRDPRKKAFGSSHHIGDALENLHHHSHEEYFDVIICNGVYGWGMNSKEQCELGLRNCYSHLRQGGELMLGWDDVPEHVFVPLESINSLARFHHQRNSPFSAWRYETGSHTRHVFDFYVKYDRPVGAPTTIGPAK
jgi:hypothetical protein